MSSKDFCDKLREGAVILASGERESIYLTDIAIRSVLAEDADRVKVTPSYIRTIMVRVPEVKQIGTVSIRRISGDIDRADGYEIKLKKESRKRVFTESDLPAIRQRAIEKALKVNPDFSMYQGEQLEAAVKAVAAYKEAIREFCIGGE